MITTYYHRKGGFTVRIHETNDVRVSDCFGDKEDQESFVMIDISDIADGIEHGVSASLSPEMARLLVYKLNQALEGLEKGENNE